MDFILDYLAIGNHQEARDTPRDIDALLCVAQEIDIQTPIPLNHKVPILDMQPIPAAQLEEGVRWIAEHRDGHRILVFCNAGVGRSTSVVVAYLCAVLGFGFGQAVEYVAVRRPYMSILPMLITSIEETRGLLGKP